MLRVSGTFDFTFAYRLDGLVAAEFECRCDYEVRLGAPARRFPWPGEPAEADEVRDFSDIEVEVCGRVDGIPRRRWVAPDAQLEKLIRAWLGSPEGQSEICDCAREEWEAAA